MNSQVSQTQTVTQSYQRHQTHTRGGTPPQAPAATGDSLEDDRVSISDEARELRASQPIGTTSQR